MSQVVHAQSIVLHKFPYGDKDLIVRLLNSEGEILTVFAKGGQNSSKRFGPVLDLFNQIDIIAKSRPNSSMLSLQSAELRFAMDSVRTDLTKFAVASFFSEMFLVFLKEGEKLPELYDDFCGFLQDINQTHSLEEQSIPVWEYKWLQHLGFNPQFSQCVTCGDEPAQEKSYHFSEKSGGILCQPCQKSELWGGKAKMLSYQVIQGLMQNLIPRDTSHEPRATRNLRQALESFIEYTAGKNLKSLQFLNQVLA